MGILESISCVFRGRASAEPGTSTNAAVLDAETLFPSQSPGRGLRPQEKVGVLNRLAALAEKEGLSLTAVFSGPPLREAADGAQYRGITVRYVANGETAADAIVDAIKKTSGRTKPVVVTSNRDIENAIAALGASAMRSSTFRKVIEGNGERKERRGPPDTDDEDDDSEKIITDLIERV